MSQTTELPDLQAISYSSSLAICEAGISNYQHPIQVQQLNNELQNTIGDFSLSVAIPHNQRGTHMSRFIQLLNNNNESFHHDAISPLLTTMLHELQAEQGHMTVVFPFFINKKAPISQQQSLLNIQAGWRAWISPAQQHIETYVKVPVTSLCPCSKEIANYGAHNQRSSITIRLLAQQAMHFETLVMLCEQAASCPVYSTLKRVDEKKVTEMAYENPKFVEDMVRDVANALQEHKKIKRFSVYVENMESIHNHDAYACIRSHPVDFMTYPHQ